MTLHPEPPLLLVLLFPFSFLFELVLELLALPELEPGLQIRQSYSTGVGGVPSE